MFMRRMRKDRRGLTLIELIIAAAILGIITATVGGALVVATNAYRNGSIQTALQTESQFTINAIEGLIIDATDTVEFSGNVLTITNVDYTYEIVFDPVSHTLTYTQYDTNTGDPIMDPAVQLLAEHVSDFFVNADDFPTSRNVQIRLTMENNGRSFTTNYNITSRNNPNAGESIEMTAVINVEHEIVLEPNQNYTLDVSVIGPSNNSFSAKFEDEGDHSINAYVDNITTSGLDIHIGATETGGDDQKLILKISTNAKAADGTSPLNETYVYVYIRRINEMTFLTGADKQSGTALKAGAIYTVTADPVGSRDDILQRWPQRFDDDYVDPKTVVWSFRTSTGENGNDYAAILNNTGEASELTFQLKQDIPAGMQLQIWATAQHPSGRNKTSSVYSTPVEDYVVLEAPKGGLKLVDGQLRRGDECYVASDLDPGRLVEDEWKRNHPGEEMPNGERYIGGFTGNIYFRYTATDGTNHSSAGYPGWIKMANQGNDPQQFKFNAADFAGMYFMTDYNIDILYSFRYNKGNNDIVYYPASAFPDGSGVPIPDVDPQYIYSFPIYAFSMGFETYQDGDWGNYQTHVCAPIADPDVTVTGGGTGLGTKDRPIELRMCQEATFKLNIFCGASANKVPFDNLLTRGNTKCYVLNGDTWTEYNNMQFQAGDKPNKDEAYIKLHLQNSQLQRGVVYKLVMERIVKPVTPHPDEYETYAYEPQPGEGGRGIIYFTIK